MHLADNAAHQSQVGSIVDSFGLRFLVKQGISCHAEVVVVPVVVVKIVKKKLQLVLFPPIEEMCRELDIPDFARDARRSAEDFLEPQPACFGEDATLDVGE